MNYSETLCLAWGLITTFSILLDKAGDDHPPCIVHVRTLRIHNGLLQINKDIRISF